MLKFAAPLFAVVIALLVIIALQPAEPPSVPAGTVLLRDATVALYPRADEGAVWYFASPDVVYDPDSGMSTLNDLSDGRRTVRGETDFTLDSERLVIDADDNLRGELIFAELQATGECLSMLAAEGEEIVVDQRAGVFRVPEMRIDGPSWGTGSQWQRVTASFDLSDFTAGGPGTATVNEFLAGGTGGNTRSTPCDT